MTCDRAVPVTVFGPSTYNAREDFGTMEVVRTKSSGALTLKTALTAITSLMNGEPVLSPTTVLNSGPNLFQRGLFKDWRR